MTMAGQTFPVPQAAPPGPAVALTTPSTGSTVSGTTNLVASASDGLGITKVEFYCDNTTLVGTATAAPYSAPCNTTGLPNGTHTFSARAFGTAGNSPNSVANTVTVSNGATTPPGQYEIGRAHV